MSLQLHVTRLTQAEEVRRGVRSFRCGKQPIRSEVMDGQARADVPAATSAAAPLLGDHQEADTLPVPTAVGHGAADPPGRSGAAPMLAPIRIPAAVGAIVARSPAPQLV